MDPYKLGAEVLSRHCHHIRKSSLDAAEVLAHLVQDGAVNRSVAEHVRSRSSQSDKIDAIVDAVKKGGPGAYVSLLDAIKGDRSTGWLAKVLEGEWAGPMQYV